MAEKDIAAIDYFEDKDRFADLYNVYYFDGNPIIKPEDVHERNRSNSMVNRKTTKKEKDEMSTVINRDIVREIDTWMVAVLLAEDAYYMICQFSHSSTLDNNTKYKTKRGGVNMCKALDDLIAEGEARGLERGEKLGLERGKKLGLERGMIQGIIKICQEMEISIELTTLKIMKECNLSEDNAKEYMQKYWK